MQGRFVFLADCQASLATMVPLADRGAVGRNIMARHSSVFKGLAPDVREEYEARAALLVVAKQNSIDDE
eukprot:16440350-Heterocapsa_arctica.AAC.1